MSSDPLASLPRPTGSPEALSSIARQWTAGSQVLGRTSQVMMQMTGRVLAQAWSGQAATSCASSCVNDAGLVAMTADSYEIAGNSLSRYATVLSTSQETWDKARRLADQALDDEKTQNSPATQANAMAQGLPVLIGATYVSPLRSSAKAMAQQAITDVRNAGTTAAGALQDTIKPFLPKPAAARAKPKSHWYSPVTNLLGGAWDGVKDPAVMIGGLVGLHGDAGKNWSDLGHGLAHGFTHPLDLGKAMIDWQDLSQGHYARWTGELLPTAVAAFFTGGTAAAVKGTDAVGITAKSGEALDDLSEADKVAALTKGEDLVPGMVGKEIPAKYLTEDGNLDYSGVFDRELKNFSSIDHVGPTTLDKDTWLVNVHDGRAALNGGRSLKFSAPPDEVLANSRGGYLNRLALVPQWGKRTDMSIIHIPAGTDVDLAVGGTKEQISHLTVNGHEFEHVSTGVKTGGGTQVLLKQVDRDWVVWTGKAPWPTTGQVLTHAAVGAGTVRVPDVLSDVSQNP